MAIYQLPYDENLDKDIHEWLKSLPRNRKAEMVRNAIRFYIQTTQSSNQIVINPTNIQVLSDTSKQEQKKRPTLPTDGNF